MIPAKAKRCIFLYMSGGVPQMDTFDYKPALEKYAGKPMPQTTYSFFKVSEGGFGQKLALTLLRGEGIRAEPATSPYVGQTAVIVYGGKRIQKKAEQILFNY